jgi:tetratricopeptide (TPR) repeat protein
VGIRIREPEAALAIAEAFLRRRPDQGAAHRVHGGVLSHLGRYDESLRAYAEAIRRLPGDRLALSALSYVQAKAGNRKAARRTLAALKDAPPLLRVPGLSDWMTATPSLRRSPQPRPRTITVHLPGRRHPVRSSFCGSALRRYPSYAEGASGFVSADSSGLDPDAKEMSGHAHSGITGAVAFVREGGASYALLIAGSVADRRRSNQAEDDTSHSCRTAVIGSIPDAFLTGT